MALTRLSLEAATVERCRVLDVDTRNYVCTVATEFTQKPLAWISWTSLYEHYENGEGVYCMPEVGSIAWVVEPSDGSMPFIIGWTAVEDANASHRGRKMDLNPGDIYLGTRDENRIILRRGGVIQIGATPLSQRIYLPINNIIKDLCENYSLQTLAGTFDWSVGIAEDSQDGKRPTKVVLTARERADDAKPVATLQIGSHSDTDPTILSLVLNDSGATGQKPKITLQLKKTGDVTWTVKKQTAPAQVLWDIEGTFTVKATNDISLRSEMNAELVGKLTAKVEGGVVNLASTSGAVAVSAAAGMTVKTPGRGPALTVGAGTEPVLKSSLLTWLAMHTHTCASPGAQSAKPAQPIPNVVSKDLLTS